MNVILKSFPQLESTAYSPEIEFLEIGGEKKWELLCFTFLIQQRLPVPPRQEKDPET